MKITTEFRILAGLKPSSYRYPIRIIEGNEEPLLVGERPYFTTPNGKRIFHPGAYCWPKIYHRSSKRIEVGKLFVHKKYGLTAEKLLKGIYGKELIDTSD